MTTNANSFRWDAVGYESNPIPGDTELAADVLRRYTNLQTYFEDMVTALRGLKGESTMTSRGQWFTALGKSSEELAQDLDAFAESLRQLTDALSQWNSSMESCIDAAQRQLENAAVIYDQIQRDLSSYHEALGNVETGLRAVNASSEGDEYYQTYKDYLDNAKTSVASYGRKIGDERSELDDIKNTVRRIVDDYNTNGHEAARKIASAEDEIPHEAPTERLLYSGAWEVAITVVDFASSIAGFVAVFVGGWFVIAAGALAAAVWMMKISKRMMRDGFEQGFNESLPDTLSMFLAVVPAAKVAGNAFAAAAGTTGKEFLKTMTRQITKETSLTHAGETTVSILRGARKHVDARNTAENLWDIARSTSSEDMATTLRTAAADNDAYAKAIVKETGHDALSKGWQAVQEDVPCIAIEQRAEKMTAILKESGMKFTNETWSRLAKVCGWEGVKTPVGGIFAIGTEATKDVAQVTKPYWNEHYGKRSMTINDIYAGALKPAAVDAAQDLKTSASAFASLFQRKQQN